MRMRRLGSQGLEVSEQGLGCMGMSEFYGPTRRRASRSATIHRALELGIDVPRHRRLLRPAHERGARRPGDRRPPRRGRPRDEVRHRPRARTDPTARGSTGRPSTCARPARRSLRRLGVDTHRPLLPAPRRPRGPDRGDGRRDGGARARRARCATSGSRRRPPETIRRAHAVHPISGAADGVLALEPRSRGRAAADRARARDRLRRLQPARPRLPDRPLRVAGRPRGRRLPADARRASRGELRAQPRARRARARRSRPRRARRRASSRSPGCWRRETTSCRSRARSASPTWRRTRPRSELELTPEDLARLDEAAPQGAAAGDRYRDMSYVDR